MTKRKVSRSKPKCEQVKTFARQNLDNLEADINMWLRERVGKIDIISREVIEQEIGYRAVIWYREPQ